MEQRRVVILPYRQIALIIGILLGLYLFGLSFKYLSSIYIPILVSYFFAFLLNPIISTFDKRGLGRSGPSILLLVLFFALLALVMILMLPRLIVQLREFIDHLPSIISSLTSFLSPYSMQYLGYDLFVDWQRFAQDLLPQIRELPATEIVGSFFSGTLRAIGAIASVLIVPILTFYLLKDYPYWNSSLQHLVPRRHLGAFQEVTRRLSIVLGGLIRGQLLVCLILATYYAVALGALGLKLSMVLGLIGGLLNLIPFVGMLTAMALSVTLALIAGGGLTLCAGVVGVFLVGNLVDNTILTPRIIGKQMGISPLTIILAILAGGEMLGFLGMLLALPVTAMVKVLGGYLLEQYYSSNYYKVSLDKEA